MSLVLHQCGREKNLRFPERFPQREYRDLVRHLGPGNRLDLMLEMLRHNLRPTFGRCMNSDLGLVHHLHHRSRLMSGVHYRRHYRVQRLRFLLHHILCHKLFRCKRPMAGF